MMKLKKQKSELVSARELAMIYNMRPLSNDNIRRNLQVAHLRFRRHV